MKILVSGSTGFVGTALVNELQRRGNKVTHLTRKRIPGCDGPQILWDISKGKLDASALEGFDSVIHLAGENIAGGRWTEERKKRILESRTKGTALLSNALASLQNPPKVMISTSAIGYYGAHKDERITEVSSLGKGFLAQVCQAWEAATKPAEAKGIRVIHTRFGVVLHPDGGALKAMYWPFKLGVAGDLGNGKQFMSWIAREDLVNAICFLLEQTAISGPVNLTAPEPVRNSKFTKILRKKLIPPVLPMHYWTPPAPAIAVSLVMGQMADEMLLSGAAVYPVRLEEAGFTFKYPTLQKALDAVL